MTTGLARVVIPGDVHVRNCRDLLMRQRSMQFRMFCYTLCRSLFILVHKATDELQKHSQQHDCSRALAYAAARMSTQAFARTHTDSLNSYTFGQVLDNYVANLVVGNHASLQGQ